MRIPTEHIDLEKDLGYEGYWVEMPKSIKEGFLREFSKIGRQAAQVDDNSEAADETSRETYAKLLELVSAWNLDDESGKVLPLLSKVKSKSERDRVVAELPIDIIVFLANRVTSAARVPEGTRDF